MLKKCMQLLLAIKLNISIFNHSTISGFFRSCKILFGLVKFMTAPDRMSGNVWKVFVNTVIKLQKHVIMAHVFMCFYDFKPNK